MPNIPPPNKPPPETLDIDQLPLPATLTQKALGDALINSVLLGDLSGCQEVFRARLALRGHGVGSVIVQRSLAAPCFTNGSSSAGIA